ncbi:MAG: hypothetical protein PHX83_11925 [Acidobacteriia bacterium]|nr:hypothetical protein [Terriglobia bacterium]
MWSPVFEDCESDGEEVRITSMKAEELSKTRFTIVVGKYVGLGPDFIAGFIHDEFVGREIWGVVFWKYFVGVGMKNG